MTPRRKFTGAKHDTETVDAYVSMRGRRAFQRRRSMTEKTCGASGSENAGMSNERQVRILSAARLRFPGAGSSAQGKSGPKARPRGVVDGQQVDIPVLHPIVMSEGGTQEASSAWCWKPCSSAESGNESNAYFFKDKL